MPSNISIMLATLLVPSVLLNLYLLPFHPAFSLSFNTELTAQNSTTLANSAVEHRAKAPTQITTKPLITPSIQPVGSSAETSNSAEMNSLQQLFNQHQFESAINALLSLPQATQAPILQHWIAELAQMLANNQTLAVIRFCDYYLIHHPFDPAILKLIADAHIQHGNLSLGLGYLYQLAQRLPPIKEAALLKQIHTLSDKTITTLSQQQAWPALQELVLPLMEYETDYGAYHLALANAHFHLAAYDDALLALELILDDPEYGRAAIRLRQQILQAMQTAQAIPLTALGEHFVVAGLIDQQFGVELLIDTGASLCVLSRQQFEAIHEQTDVTFIHHRQIATAGGVVNAPLYRFASFAIGPFVVHDIEFVVLELNDMQGSDGLLGMNFLKQFKFELNQQEQQLLLLPRS